MTIEKVNGKFVSFKAAKPKLGEWPLAVMLGSDMVYPKVRLNSIDGGLKGYSIPYNNGKGCIEGVLDYMMYGDYNIVSAILRSDVDGSRIAVVIGRVVIGRAGMNSRRWKWCKSLSSEKVNTVEDNGYETVELKYDRTEKDRISLDFYDQKSGVSVLSKFNIETGEEIDIN
jgi:hypothetical protein